MFSSSLLFAETFLVLKVRPTKLMLSPSDGALKSSVKPVSDILEEGEEERGVMSEVGGLSLCDLICVSGLMHFIFYLFRARLFLRACVVVFSAGTDPRARKRILSRPRGTLRKGCHHRRRLIQPRRRRRGKIKKRRRGRGKIKKRRRRKKRRILPAWGAGEGARGKALMMVLVVVVRAGAVTG